MHSPRGKEDVVPDAPKASGNDAMPVDDIETAYRLYARRNFTGMENTAMSAGHRDGYGGLHSRLTDPFDRVSG
jgi:hypothetical protein